MKVFISWSETRSYAIASSLRDWIPLVLHFVDPFLSNSDINAGGRWSLEIAKELEATDCGILCLTPENVNAPWILFESGALAKSMQQGQVIPMLFEMDFSEISGPLAQFQAKKLDKSGVGDLVQSINKIARQPVPDGRLGELFDSLWPKLDEKISLMPATSNSKPKRPQHDILEELVTSVRSLEARMMFASEDKLSSRHKFYISPGSVNRALAEMRVSRRDPLRLLVVASILRDPFPWIYELGLEAYRAIRDGNTERREEMVSMFMSAINSALRSGIIENERLDKDFYFMIRDLEVVLLKGFETGGSADENEARQRRSIKPGSDES